MFWRGREVCTGWAVADLREYVQIRQWDPLSNFETGKARYYMTMASGIERMINNLQMGRGQDHVTIL